MQRVGLNVAIATLVFWLVSTVWNTGGLGDLLTFDRFASALVFAMLYGAVQVAMVLFFNSKNGEE